MGEIALLFPPASDTLGKDENIVLEISLSLRAQQKQSLEISSAQFL